MWGYIRVREPLDLFPSYGRERRIRPEPMPFSVSFSFSSLMAAPPGLLMGPRSLSKASTCVCASQSMDNRSDDKVYKELGLYSLRRNVEDIVNRVEAIAPAALELEEERKIKQEEILRKCNLWDDLNSSDEFLAALADSSKVVDSLKDLQYKAEEANLITELAETDVVNHQLLEQAYKSSLDASKLLYYYEISKLLTGPFDQEGACLTIKAGSTAASEAWAEKLYLMYAKWAEKHGCNKRVVEKYPSESGGIKSATMEFESENIYGYLSGERGSHSMIRGSVDGLGFHQECWATVDVIPLFLNRVINLDIDENDIVIFSSNCKSNHTVSIHHIPTGIIIQSSGERSLFANKIKALNRLKAKLLVIADEQGVSDIKKNKRGIVENELNCETRFYMLRPQKLVRDLKTGMQLSDLNSVLDGDIEPFIRSHTCLRFGRDMD